MNDEREREGDISLIDVNRASEEACERWTLIGKLRESVCNILREAEESV